MENFDLKSLVGNHCKDISNIRRKRRIKANLHAATFERAGRQRSVVSMRSFVVYTFCAT